MPLRLFFELLQMAVGSREKLSYCPTEEEWGIVWNIVKKQAVIGVCSTALEKLEDNQRPPKDVTQKWAAMVVRIEQFNRRMNDKCREITEMLMNDGFECCILKGQGIALLYPEPLLRQSGDIDVWITCHNGKRAKKKDIVRYVQKINPASQAMPHHVDIRLADVDVEMHYRPAYFCNPLTNIRFNKWANKYAVLQNRNDDIMCNVPSLAFNRVFLMVHIFKHFLFEGIGMRQIMDYFFLLQNKCSDEEREETVKTLKSLNMLKFTGALMWVISEVFGMSREQMLVEPDSKNGKVLLQCIMEGGNFGQYSSNRIIHNKADSHLIRFVKESRLTTRMIKHYPSEVIWQPWSKVKTFFAIRLYRYISKV